jgi:hypothetical protein
VFWIPVLLVLMPGEEHFNYRCLQFRIQLLWFCPVALRSWVLLQKKVQGKRT